MEAPRSRCGSGPPFLRTTMWPGGKRRKATAQHFWKPNFSYGHLKTPLGAQALRRVWTKSCMLS
eukprot:11208317-Lingulodinium_polyedra.AAC.1